jgi:peptide chain release factor 1
VTGHNVWRYFKYETGKHVIQRHPKNGKGKKHTSVVTVGVLPIPPDNSLIPIPSSELEITAQCGRQKAGGQNVNRVHSACRIKHIPTGVSVFINGRDFHRNKIDALKIITMKVNDNRIEKLNSDYSTVRKLFLGNSSRGDKIRTYNFTESRVTDHRFNIKTRDIKRIVNGEIGLLYPQEK